MPQAQHSVLLTLPGLMLALMSQTHLEDREEASAKWGHSHKRNSQSQTMGICQQKDLAGRCFVLIYFYAL